MSPGPKALRDRLLAWALVTSLALVAAFAFWPQPIRRRRPRPRNFAAFATLAGLWRALDRRPATILLAAALRRPRVRPRRAY